MDLGVFEMVVLVTLIGCATGVISKYLATERKTTKSMKSEEFDDALDRIEELEDRINILEKIGTDEHRKLAREFNGPKQR
ncbi:MAG: hypothetical protein CMP98_12690 [Gammaproteobacteria bacterium]|nr:hypothetical protein [Gammaproteobacteria bacterium]OUU07536.1 MAG: hypothetical protein CBB94_13320 [Gammaproteobacteria bacterium TMED34]|tara:strand:- start:450 stop:689 length:240 start_codon:yes stop_codon:yes gene_type:complete